MMIPLQLAGNCRMCFPHRPLSGIGRWSLRCLLALLLGHSLIQPPLLLADSPLVTQEIRYHMPEANEVFLVWGLNGWQVAPEAMRPAGTRVKDAVMHTPMVKEGDIFVSKVQVPHGATIDYGFLITQIANNSGLSIWEADGEQNYQTKATSDGVIEVETKLSLAQNQISTNIPDSRLSLLLSLSLAFALGAIVILRGNVIVTRFRTLTFSYRLIYLGDLLRELVARDMKLRYKRSVLGLAWSLLNPLAQLLVFSFIFSLILPLNIPNYPSFLFIGLLVWTWFQSSLFGATTAIVDSPELIRRPGFPVAILPIVTVTTNLIHLLLALPILFCFLLFSQIPLTGVILALPLVIVLQFLLTLSLAYLIAAIHVIFRDTQYLLGIFLLLGFYLSPIFYEATLMPESYQLLYRLNPMVDLTNAYRAILMKGVLPDYLPLLIIGLLSLGLLYLGYTTFMRQSYRFVEEL